MSDNYENKKRKGKKKKCKIKCSQCEFYDAPLDYCSEKNIEYCSSQSNINFSSCDSFLIREDLMFF